MVDGRIHALARAHNQITDDHWGPAPMQALIDAEAAAFVDERERVDFGRRPGPAQPQAYSTMALVVHELDHQLGNNMAASRPPAERCGSAGSATARATLS